MDFDPVFPFNLFPQRVGTDGYDSSTIETIRFHSTYFPSEWGHLTTIPVNGSMPLRFHSTYFPSEWGLLAEDCLLAECWEFPFNLFPQRVGTLPSGCLRMTAVAGFHSTYFPSEWGLWIPFSTLKFHTVSFHSTYFPSEWGHLYLTVASWR